MTFIFGVEKKEGIYTYTQDFDKEEYKITEHGFYIALLRDKYAYEDYVDTTTYTDLGIFSDYERAHEGYKKGCMDFAMERSDPNQYVGKMWHVNSCVNDFYEKKYYEIIEYCLIESIKPGIQENKVVFIANTREIRIRRKDITTDGLDYVQFAHNPYNVYIVNSIIEGKTTMVTPCIENQKQIESVANDSVRKFYKMFFRKFED